MRLHGRLELLPSSLAVVELRAPELCANIGKRREDTQVLVTRTREYRAGLKLAGMVGSGAAG